MLARAMIDTATTGGGGDGNMLETKELGFGGRGGATYCHVSRYPVCTSF